MTLLEGIAWAAGPQAAAGTSSVLLYQLLIPAAIFFVIFYFIGIRPQVKKTQQHQKMLEGLKRNDEVVTSGGILGRIVEVGDRVVTLEVAPNVRIRVEKVQIAALSGHGRTPRSGKDKGRDSDSASRSS